MPFFTHLLEIVKLNTSQPAKMDLNKKFFPKQNTIQTFNIDV